jgi:hypothetical protein
MPEQTLTVAEIQKLIDERAEVKAKELFDKLHQQPPAIESKPTPAPVVAPVTEKPPHKMRTWEKTCPECGDVNPDYKKADAYCADCGSPIGNVPKDWTPPKPGESKELPEIKPCWNCGSSKAKLAK